MKHVRIFKTLALIILIMSLTAAFPAVNAKAANSASTAGIVSVSSGSLNVRSTASTSGTVLTKLSNGSYVTLMEKSGTWWRVEYGPSKYGYVSSNYIKSVSGTRTANVTAATLNVRTGAGTSYSIKSVLQNGKTVIVLSGSGSWSRILYNGTQTGYVSSKYLSGSSSSMTWPVPASQKINQYFSSSHLGIDIDSAAQGVSGDSVVASCSGTVVYAGWLSGYGNVVYVNSYYGGKYIQTRYGHLSSVLVSVGNTVYAGQKIGLMGNTGTSYGVHLHFEVRIRNSAVECLANSQSSAVNPMNYLTY